MQKIPGDAAVTLRPADHQCRDAGTAHGKPADQSILLSQHRETKDRAQDTREDHYTPENFRMEWVWKNLLRRYRVRRTAGNSSACYRYFANVLWSWRRDLNPRPPDYKSGALPTELRQQFGKDAPSRKLIPLIPARCPGQLIKLSQWELLAQPGSLVRNMGDALASSFTARGETYESRSVRPYRHWPFRFVRTLGSFGPNLSRCRTKPLRFISWLVLPPHSGHFQPLASATLVFICLSWMGSDNINPSWGLWAGSVVFGQDGGFYAKPTQPRVYDR